MPAIVEFHLGDIVRLRKPHPCGSYEWCVVRLGADIGLRCLGCDHRILLPRSTLERRLKGFVQKAGPEQVKGMENEIPTKDVKTKDQGRKTKDARPRTKDQ
jgi:hypothetical protein